MGINFFLSGLISFAMFISACILFIYILFSSKHIDTYAFNKKNIIKVSIIIPKRAKKKNKAIEQRIQISKPQPTLKSLFSRVKVSDINKTNKLPKLNNIVIRELSKKFLFSKKKIKSKLIKSDQIITYKRVKVKNQEVSTGQKVNKYRAKIQAIIYNNFFPPINTVGQSAKVLLSLSANGMVLKFEVLIYSGSEMFNNEINRLKDRIMNIVFPENPKQEAGEYIITLTAHR